MKKITIQVRTDDNKNRKVVLNGDGSVASGDAELAGEVAAIIAGTESAEPPMEATDDATDAAAG